MNENQATLAIVDDDKNNLLSLEKVIGEYLKVWKRELVTPLRKGRDYLPLYALH